MATEKKTTTNPKAAAAQDTLRQATGTDERANYDVDERTGAKVIDSIVLRGDLSGLGPSERARFYVQMCEGLGLNPHAQPFAFLRLNGKEILYATRGATDQLAAMHRVTREIIDGPKVIDLAGTKLVYCVCRASMPNGRFETSVATVPLTDPVNVLMKCETKGKRRATLSILGLGVLDELEIETIPAGAQEPGGSVDLTQGNPTADIERDEPPAELGGFYESAREVETIDDAVALWTGKHRPALLAATPRDREAAQSLMVRRVRELGGEELAPKGAARAWFLRAVEKALATPSADGASEQASDTPPALAGFYARVGEIELPGEAVAVWMKFRTDLGPLPIADREAAWRALCKRTEEVGRMKNAKVWLKKAIAEEDARKGHAGGSSDPQAA